MEAYVGSSRFQNIVPAWLHGPPVLVGSSDLDAVILAPASSESCERTGWMWPEREEDAAAETLVNTDQRSSFEKVQSAV